MAARKSRQECTPTFYDMISPFRRDHILVFHVMDWCNYWAFAEHYAAEPAVTESIETNQILATIADMLLPAAATEEE